MSLRTPVHQLLSDVGKQPQNRDRAKTIRNKAEYKEPMNQLFQITVL